ncbi:MAG: hypothetical protein U0457_01575 [Candidatus Sericytochromatia bacterium]
MNIKIKMEAFSYKFILVEEKIVNGKKEVFKPNTIERFHDFLVVEKTEKDGSKIFFNIYYKLEKKPL